MSPVIIGVVVVYLLFLLVIGVWGGKESHDLEGYYAAGKKLPAWVLAFSSNATGESAWLLLGLTGIGYALGMHALWVVLGEVLGVALAWAYVARPFKAFTDRYGSITVPDYLEDRFRDKTHSFRIVGAVIVLSMVAFYVGAQLTATGKAFNSFLGTGYHAGVFIGLAVVLFYTVVGGFKAVAYSDFAQGVLMFTCLLILPFVGLSAVGGWGALMDGLRAAEPLAAFEGLQAAGVRPPAAGRRARAHPARDRERGRVRGRGTRVPRCPAASGAVPRGARPARDPEGGAGRRRLHHRVRPGRRVHGDGRPRPVPQPRGPRDGAPGDGRGAAARSVHGSRPRRRPRRHHVDGRFAADPRLLRGGAGRLSEDLPPRRPQRALSVLGKAVTVVLGITGLLLALTAERAIFWFVLFAWSGLAAAFAPVVLCSLFWAGTTRAGAVAGMIAGFLVTMLWVVLFKEGFYDLYEMLPGFAAGFAVTIGVSLFTRPPPGAAEELAAIREEISRRPH